MDQSADGGSPVAIPQYACRSIKAKEEEISKQDKIGVRGAVIGRIGSERGDSHIQ